jgi:hypothetical protein
MAPSSPTDASTRKPSHLHVVTDGIHKSDTHNHIRARRLSVRRLSTHSVSDDWAPAAEMDQSMRRMSTRSLSDDWAPATEMDQDSVFHREPSVERPEDICKLSDDKWDPDDVCWGDDTASDAEPANANEYHAASAEWTDENDALLQLLDINYADTPSDLEDEAAFLASLCESL